MADSKAKQVRNFVQALGRDDRYIVMLYYADGLTPMEISRVLDLPSGRVRTRLAELRSQLSSLTRTVTAPAATIGPDTTGPSHAAYA